MNRLARAFLQLAEEDLAAARQLLPNLLRPAAFHLQQAAEKLVKAELASGDLRPVPKSHDIAYLVSLLPAEHPRRAAMASLASLTSLAVMSRCPIGDAVSEALTTDDLVIYVVRLEDLLQEAQGG